MRTCLVMASLLVTAGCVERVDVLGPGPFEVGTGGMGGGTSGAGGQGGEPTPQPPVFDQVSAAFEHTCAIADGQLFCWGRNDLGMLGLGDLDRRLVPTRVGTGADWKEVATGSEFTCALRTSGGVSCTGGNTSGELGLGDFTDRTEFTLLNTTAPVSRIGGTRYHMMAIYFDGTLWNWGRNAEGQLGQADPFPAEGVDRNEPVQVEDDNDWTFAEGADGHSCGIRGGALWCWGRNNIGQLGIGPDAPGQIRIPQLVEGPQNWVQVRGGHSHSCGRRNDGTLWCWGDNMHLQLGLGAGVTADTPQKVGSDADWKDMSLATFHTCGVKTDGSLWCWGRNFEGQLGTGDDVAREFPTRVGTDADWDAVSNGRFHTCARKVDGSVWCTGQNKEGQLGVGDLETRFEMTAVVLPTP